MRNLPKTNPPPSPKTAGKDKKASQPSHPRKRQIIAAYRSVLIREGHAAASMRRIAEECNMKLGHLQYYYSTRNELIEAFIKYWVDLEQAGRGVLLNKELPSIDSILKWVDGAFTHSIQRNFENGIGAVELWSMACHDDQALALLTQWYEDERSYTAKMVRAAIPQLSKRASEQRASAVIALLEGLVTQLVVNESVSTNDLLRARKTLMVAARAVLQAPIT